MGGCAQVTSCYLRVMGILGFQYGSPGTNPPATWRDNCTSIWCLHSRSASKETQTKTINATPSFCSWGNWSPERRGFPYGDQIAGWDRAGAHWAQLRVPLTGPHMPYMSAPRPAPPPGSQSQESAVETILPLLLFEQKAGGLSKEEEARVWGSQMWSSLPWGVCLCLSGNQGSRPIYLISVKQP